MNALVVIETLTPAVFSEPNGIDAMLLKLESEVRAVATDISTPAGRKAVASLAYKVARSRSAFDEMGKDLVSDWKKQAKAVDQERSRVWDRLEALQTEVRKPLTDWEDAEKDRITAHEQAILSIVGLALFDHTPSAADITFRLDAFHALPARDWQEFAKPASQAEAATTATLTRMHEEASKREAEEAELARLRAEQVAREQKEHDEKIRSDAATKSRLDAEAKAKRDADAVAEATEAERRRIAKEAAGALERAETAERNAKAAADRAEREKIEAAAEADRDRVAAVETERKRVADAEAAEAAETARREANKSHRKAINSESLASLVAAGLTVEQGVIAITAIVRGAVPHVRIAY